MMIRRAVEDVTRDKHYCMQEMVISLIMIDCINVSCYTNSCCGTCIPTYKGLRRCQLQSRLGRFLPFGDMQTLGQAFLRSIITRHEQQS